MPKKKMPKKVQAIIQSADTLVHEGDETGILGTYDFTIDPAHLRNQDEFNWFKALQPENQAFIQDLINRFYRHAKKTEPVNAEQLSYWVTASLIDNWHIYYFGDEIEFTLNTMFEKTKQLVSLEPDFHKIYFQNHKCLEDLKASYMNLYPGCPELINLESSTIPLFKDNIIPSCIENENVHCKALTLRESMNDKLKDMFNYPIEMIRSGFSSGCMDDILIRNGRWETQLDKVLEQTTTNQSIIFSCGIGHIPDMLYRYAKKGFTFQYFDVPEYDLQGDIDLYSNAYEKYSEARFIENWTQILGGSTACDTTPSFYDLPDKAKDKILLFSKPNHRTINETILLAQGMGDSCEMIKTARKLPSITS